MANFSYTRSRHSIKAGANVIRRQFNFFQSNMPRGQFNFDSNFTNDPTGATPGSGNSIASMLLGFPSSTSRTTEIIEPGYRSLEFSNYFQDDWRVRAGLTLNLRVRYDVFIPFV